MPTRQISNPAGVWGGTAQAEPVTVGVVNNSAGTLIVGDVVVVDATGTLATTTTIANMKTVLGPVCSKGDASTNAETEAIGSPMLVAVGGVARVQIGANTVAIGDLLASSTAAKTADVNNAATAGQAFAVALEASTAKDANNTIRCLIVGR